MKKYRYLYAICLVAVGLITACSQEELMDGEGLPEGQFPVEIASVSISGESSTQPWGAHSPQTRMYDSADGKESYWYNHEQFFLEFKEGEAVGIDEWAAGGASGYLTDTPPVPLYWCSATQEGASSAGSPSQQQQWMEH